MPCQPLKNTLRKRLRCINMPDDLEGITRIDTDGETPAEEAGLEPAAVDAVWQAVLDTYRAGAHPLLSIGYQRGDAADANAVVAELNTPICLFSSSKAISAMLLHLLAEQGKIHLLDPISYYIPEFAANGKSFITIYQLLAHRAGVPGVGEEVDSEILYDHDRALAMICAAKPIDGHGRTAAYHAITGGYLIDELIRRTTGLTIQQYMDRHVRKPMGMRYFRYGVTKRDMPKLAEHRVTGLKPGKFIGGTLKGALGIDYEEAVALSDTDDFRTAVLPSGNLCCTAEEAGRFFQMLLDYGRYQDKQIMQPLTVHRAPFPETGPRPRLGPGPGRLL